MDHRVKPGGDEEEEDRLDALPDSSFEAGGAMPPHPLSERGPD
jgi:hypothetical protein